MKKLLAIILLLIIISLVFFMGYINKNTITEGFIMLLSAIVFGGLGGFAGMFICNNLISKK